MEYYRNGNYYKSHLQSKQLSIPLNYSEIFKLFQEDFVNKMNIVEKSKRRKLWVIANFFEYSGRQAFPLIRKDSRGVLLSTYTNEEIKQLLDIINTDTRYGKCIYSILTILAYLGLRAGDIINLKFEHIDFENNEIKFYYLCMKQLVEPKKFLIYKGNSYF